MRYFLLQPLPLPAELQDWHHIEVDRLCGDPGRHFTPFLGIAWAILSSGVGRMMSPTIADETGNRSVSTPPDEEAYAYTARSVP